MNSSSNKLYLKCDNLVHNFVLHSNENNFKSFVRPFGIENIPTIYDGSSAYNSLHFQLRLKSEIFQPRIQGK